MSWKDCSWRIDSSYPLFVPAVLSVFEMREGRLYLNAHIKKMIAPIIITIIVVLYFVIYFGVLISMLDSILLKLLLGIVPALLGATMIGVCIQRIGEIKGGEEDDLSQY